MRLGSLTLLAEALIHSSFKKFQSLFLKRHALCAVVVERDSSEFARLSQLGDILGLNPMEINSVHTGLAEQAYRGQVQQVGPPAYCASVACVTRIHLSFWECI